MPKNEIATILAHVIAESRTLDESDFLSSLDISSLNNDVIKKNPRLNAWLQIASDGDLDQFQKTLNARKKLSKKKSNEQWCIDANWILQEIIGFSDEHNDVVVKRYPDIPFIDLFSRLLQFCQKKLESQHGTYLQKYFSESALYDFEKILVHQLSEVCSPLLYKDFEVFRSHNPEDEYAYAKFIDASKKERFCTLLYEYPVLLRIISLLIRQWLDTTKEFLDRIEIDGDRISSKLACINFDNRISSIRGFLSDRHANGRSVLLITLQDQNKFLYKPKYVTLENNFYNLVNELNSHGGPIELRAMKTLDMGAYGWTEFIENKSCKGTEDFKKFYFRAGCLLALFHILQGKDIHDENIIAYGDFPVPIDLEVLFQTPNESNQLSSLTAFEAWQISANKISNLAISVGMLPNLGYDEKQRVYDVGGLNGNRTISTELGWDDVNTSKMSYRIVENVKNIHTNIPNFEHRIYGGLEDNFEELIDGFHKYSLFLSTKTQKVVLKFLDEDFKGNPTRKLRRPTAFYYLLTKRLKHYKNFRSGFEWSVQGEFLYRQRNSNLPTDEEYKVIAIEKDELLNLSIPLFHESSEFEVSVNASNINSARQKSIEKFKQLDENEIRHQIEMIRWSLGSIRKKKVNITYNKSKCVLDSNLIADEENTKDAIDKRINNIFEKISTSSIKASNSAAWIGLDWFDNSEIYRLNTIGNGLYSGNIGIALFLSGYYKYRKDNLALALCNKALAITKHHISGKATEQWINSIGIGAGNGVAGIVYGLATLDQILNSGSYLELSQELSLKIPNKLIDNDEHLDIISGASGLIVSLVKLYQLTNNQTLLNTAVHCGEMIDRKINQRIKSSGTLLNGFSHGLSGISYALLKLFKVTNLKKFEDLSQKLIEIENISYSLEYKNWPDNRTNPPDYNESRWCHGACGIGLSRAGFLKINISERNRQTEKDLVRSITASNIYWPKNNITLCCGSIGNLELLKSAEKLNNLNIRTPSSQTYLSEVLDNYDEISLKTWGENGEPLNPGFFQGISGVGYSLLRFAGVELPNVALFE